MGPEYMQLCRLMKDMLDRMEGLEKQLSELKDTVSTMEPGTLNINWPQESSEDSSDSDSDSDSESEGAQSAPF